MAKYGEFTIIFNKKCGENFYDIFNIFLPSDTESHYMFNDDIIFTFYNNSEESYSQREIYSVTEDYENKYFNFANEYFADIMHPAKINMSTSCMELEIPRYNEKTKLHFMNFSQIYNNIQNGRLITKSRYNCIYREHLTKNIIFSIAKYKSSNKFPSFMFCYDDSLLSKKDVIYLIKKIIDMNFK
jgi:hypothetical protein